MLARGLEIYLPKITAKRNREIGKNLVKCHLREEFDIDLIFLSASEFLVLLN